MKKVKQLTHCAWIGVSRDPYISETFKLSDVCGFFVGPQTISQIHLRMNDDRHFKNVDEW